MVIRVSGTGGPRAASSSKKTDKAKSTGKGFASALSRSGATDASPGADSVDKVDTVAPVSSVDALLAMQQVDDAMAGKTRKRQAMEWGEKLIDQLDRYVILCSWGRFPRKDYIN